MFLKTDPEWSTGLNNIPQITIWACELVHAIFFQIDFVFERGLVLGLRFYQRSCLWYR